MSKTLTLQHSMLAIGFVGVSLLFVGCGSPADAPAEPTDTPLVPTEQPQGAEPTPSTADAAGDGCFIHLFDDDDFDESDAHYILSEPGRYDDLASLPGATQDWTDAAESLRVGAAAKVTLWSETNFQGNEKQLEAGSEEPDVEEEPSSLELTCE